MAWPASPGGFIYNLDVFKSDHYQSLMGLSDTISCLFLLLYDFPKDISSHRLRECLSGLLPPMAGGGEAKGVFMEMTLGRSFPFAAPLVLLNEG